MRDFKIDIDFYKQTELTVILYDMFIARDLGVKQKQRACFNENVSCAKLTRGQLYWGFHLFFFLFCQLYTKQGYLGSGNLSRESISHWPIDKFLEYFLY